MVKQKFSKMINAPREKVWEILWGTETYLQWTAAFAEGSHVETDWQEGSKAVFLNAENEGMIARIAERRENEFMSIEHLGMVDKHGNEDYESDKVKGWAGAKENYSLIPENGKTKLLVEMDVDESYKDYFEKTWPKVLDKIKSIAENS